MAPDGFERMLSTREGLLQLVAQRAPEGDHLELKLDLNRSNPAWKDELRADAAALATAGTGYLVVGVDETRDGQNRAAALVGVEQAADLKRAMEDALGVGLDPPLTDRQAWCVDVADGRQVVVLCVRGRKGYPVEVVDKAARDRHVVREAGKKKWLTSAEANARRRQVEVRGLHRRYLAALMVALLAATGVVVYLVSDFRDERRLLENRVAALRARSAPRALSAEARTAFITHVAPAAGARVQVSVIAGDAEAKAFSLQVAQALADAGWEVDYAGESMSNPTPVGVVLAVATEDPTAEQAAALLIPAFQSLAIDLTPDPERRALQRGIFLRVGSKPVVQ